MDPPDSPADRQSLRSGYDHSLNPMMSRLLSSPNLVGIVDVPFLSLEDFSF